MPELWSGSPATPTCGCATLPTRRRHRAHALNIVTDLTEAAHVVKRREGRRNRYHLQARIPLPDRVGKEWTVGEMLGLLVVANRHGPNTCPLTISTQDRPAFSCHLVAQTRYEPRESRAMTRSLEALKCSARPVTLSFARGCTACGRSREAGHRRSTGHSQGQRRPVSWSRSEPNWSWCPSSYRMSRRRRPYRLSQSFQS